MTAVAFCDNTQQIVSGGLDNAIKVWDLRQNQLVYVLHGHSDTVTGLDVSADGCYLASNSMDRTGGWGQTGWGRDGCVGRTGGRGSTGCGAGRTDCGWGGWAGQDCRVGLVGGAELDWQGGLSYYHLIVPLSQLPKIAHQPAITVLCTVTAASYMYLHICIFCFPFLSHFVFLFLFSLSVRIWDIRPFAPSERQLKLLEGAQHSFEKVGHCTCPS